MDEIGFKAIRVSLCFPETDWTETTKSTEKTMLRMNLKLGPKVWYQFLKHSLMHTTHNETVNKATLVLLHCIITCSPVNKSTRTPP